MEEEVEDVVPPPGARGGVSESSLGDRTVRRQESGSGLREAEG